MAGLQLALLLLLLAGVAAASVTTEEAIQNDFPTTDLAVHCASLSSDFGPQTVAPGAVWRFAVTSTLDDPSVSCNFTAAAVSKTVELWNYVKSGYSDTPWFTCDPDCSWKLDSNGVFYRVPSGGGGYALYETWG